MNRRLLDIFWLVLLGAFVFAIPPTFHGDEPMQIYMSHDYATAFIDHNPNALLTVPPYNVDTDEQLRLINGSINRYAIGLSWHLAGFTADDLPPRPGWEWAMDYDTNVSTGHRPSDALLAASRFSSTLFLALSVAVMFALGWQFGKRPLAYFVSGLYAVNPIILLNGRRALQEGSALFFGLLVIWIAVMIGKRRREDRPAPLSFWIALIVAGGLTLASKHTGIVFSAAALAWIFVTRSKSPVTWLARLGVIGKLALSGAMMLALFIALSPALWTNPPARLVDLLQVRTNLLNIQVDADPLAPTTMGERVEGIITEPFMMPLQHFEAAFWANYQPITDEVDRYMSSPFSGVQFGVILGGALTLLAGIGIVFALLLLRSQGGVYGGLLIWLLLTAFTLLVNPLPWQRYYLSLVPVATLLSGIGLYELARRFVWKPEQPALSHAAS